MTNETTMFELLQEMKQQMKSFQIKVEEMQQQQTAFSSEQEVDEDDNASGNLVELMESIKSFLEVASSVTVTNSDHKNS